ncbi:MAG: exopolysaccharide biosynthesis polyprenyl glycosylphosphotransferase [Acidobacteria bacterium]|nr:exopolysaccharide biosynthesis polyprenyl glycosylphosphotransferase [Acidobacteriota bacterium]
MSTQTTRNSTSAGPNPGKLRYTPRRQPRVLLAGTGRAAVAAARNLLAGGMPAVLCGAIDPEPQREFSEAFPEVPWLGSFDGLADCIVANCVDELHIALPLKSFAHVISDLQGTASEVGARVTVHVDIAPWMFGAGARVNQDGLLIASREHASVSGPMWMVKRVLDVLVAGCGLILVSPLMATIALAVAFTSRGPVLFRQERVGRGQRVFRMLKFRSMVSNAEDLRTEVSAMNNARGISFKIFDDPRVTRVGAFLRRTSLDELPQLWNVVVGDMSLVGPRPIPVWVADQLTDPKLYRRFSVQPGLTGLWQVEGRQQDFDWMAMQDLRYIDKWSLLLDLRILLATIPAMIRGEGAR